LRKELNLPENIVLIGQIARYDPMKDHLNFLQATKSLLRNRSDVRFILVGRNVDFNNTELVTSIVKLNISEFVHLLGERYDLPSVMPALDIVCSSSCSEGFSNVIAEAMACGIPCVVTDVGDSALIVGNTGRVVPPKNPEALAAAWSDLIKMGPEYRRELGVAARKRIEENYNLPDIVKRYENLYEELASGVRS
jgi:glycosyltransferase involved in cell wall biosynthesis